MTEKEKLENYIKEGFKTNIFIRDVAQEEKKARVPESWWDKEVYALPLWREDNKKLMFYFIEEETKEYARLLVERGKEVIGYNLCVYISIISDAVVQGCTFHLDSVVKSLREIKRWDARLSDYPNVFEIYFKIDSGDRQKIEDTLKEVGEVSLLLTLKNEIGFDIASHSPGELYKDQPFPVNIGLVETCLKGLSSDDLTMYSEKFRNEKFVEALNALKLIYSQTNNIAKITVCWATLEDLFDRRKPTHMLSKDEINEIIGAINNTDLTVEKKASITERLKNSTLFSIKTRNERIAEEVAELLAEEYKDVRKQIGDLADCRGKLVHAVNTEDIDIREHVKFAEKTLLTYLNKA